MDSIISMYGDLYEQYDLIMPSGIPLREIVKAAKKLQVSLTVIGTHGRTGMDYIIIGTTTERVIREADCPVSAVHLSEKA